MALHETTFGFHKSTDKQSRLMGRQRTAAKAYADELDQVLPEGPDKTYVLRKLREVAMWANVAITRHPDGTPRAVVEPT